MILQIENWHMGYTQILDDCRGGGGGGVGVIGNTTTTTTTTATTATTGSVLLLCSPNVDAMAAARILAYMLRSDGVAYHLQSCWSLTSLQQQIASQPDVRAVVLINLGALKNLTRLFENGSGEGVGEGEGVGDADDDAATTEAAQTPQLLDPRRTKIYVMDCRRPIHLANVHADSHVVVFWDGVGVDDSVDDDDPEKALPSDGDDLSGQEESSEEEEENEGEDDDEEDDIEQEDDDDEGEAEAEFEDDFVNNDDDDDAVMEDARQQRDGDGDHYDGEDEQDDDDDDDDDDGDDDKENVKRRRTGDAKKSSSSSSSSHKTDTETTTSSAEDNDPNTQSQSPHEQQQEQLPSLTPRELHQERRNRIRLYYASGSYYGSPAAFVAYTVATQFRFGEIADLLWLACVGVTDAYQHARLDVSGYSTLAMQLRNSCLKLFPNDSYTRVSNTIYAEHLTGQQQHQQPSSHGGNSNNHNQDTALTKIGVSANGTILAETDYRFFLLRHSSLWEAMVLSDYCATRLQLTTARGIYKLQELLAQMGFPLTECQQPFTFMKPSLRRKLAQKLRDHAADFGLPHLEFTSFVRITGYQSLLSASDMSLALSALLECNGSGARRRRHQQQQQQQQQDSSIEQEDEEAFLHSFNAAFDALNANAHHLNITTSASATTSLLSSGEGSSLANLVNGGNLSGGGLGAGIRLAVSLQKSIMTTAAGLVDRNAITRLSHFRYAYLTCSSSGSGSGSGTAQPGQSTSERHDNNNDGINGGGGSSSKKDHVFSKPLALTRLAHYLMDLHRENGKWTGAKARPLVLLAEKPRNNSFVVVGYEYPERAGDLVKNRFGQNFSLAAQSMNGTFRFDSFDSNVVEVAASDAQRFLEQLHYLLDSANAF